MSFLGKSHRIIGLTIALLVVLLSITGIVLNHTSTLRLGAQPVPGWLASTFYGVDSHPGAVLTNNVELEVRAGKLISNKMAMGACNSLNGVIETETYLVSVCPESIIVALLSGELLEQWFYSANVIGTVKSISNTSLPNSLLLSLEGNDEYLLSLDTMSLETIPTPTVKTETILIEQSVASDITLERFIQDVHSGRFVGGWGVWLVDLSALGLIWLSVSGYLSWRQKQKLLKMDFDE